MYALILVGQVVLVIAMWVTTYWGSRNIHPETRVRARTISLDATMRTKRTALVWPPVFGLLVFLGTLAFADSATRNVGAALGLGVLSVLALAHWGTVKRAAR